MIPLVLHDLENVIRQVTPDQFGRPTPCPEFDVAALRQHMLAWADFFSVAATDPDGTGDRPDPQAYTAPDDPDEAAQVISRASQRFQQAVQDGVEDRPVKVVQSSMPGTGALSLALWEFMIHGHDLASATGQPWSPPEAAVDLVQPFAQSMLSDEYRGEGKDFAYAVDVPADAPAFERLLGFCGRDPHWTAPAA